MCFQVNRHAQWLCSKIRRELKRRGRPIRYGSETDTMVDSSSDATDSTVCVVSEDDESEPEPEFLELAYV